ncbi:hypothetical protein HWV62_42342 [Athelia sp. TMB]|nr:hypothetical protein HWV62_42342 [Athelia sp. TMB]
MFSRSLLSTLLFLGTVLAQSSRYTDPGNGIVFQGYTDPVHSVTYGAVFPPLTADSTEFVGEIVAPIANAWVGISLGGEMLDSLLLVAWPNGDSIVSSPRYATQRNPLEMGLQVPKLHKYAFLMLADWNALIGAVQPGKGAASL